MLLKELSLSKGSYWRSSVPSLKPAAGRPLDKEAEMSERDVYVEKMKAKLDEWNADLDRLEARTKAAQAEARSRYEQQIADLKAARDAAQQRLNELQHASGDAWLTLRQGTEDAWHTMVQAFRDAAERFK